MCGIAGYANISHQNFALDKTLLEKMQQAIAHRGPDGFRLWTCEQLQLGLAHRRLSIIDLSEQGFQPLFDQEQSVAVCCNGEIYNYVALREELIKLGYTFQSNSDSEVIVHAYKAWGIQCLEKLDGMFAIIIADLRSNELFLVRDRIGIKPLYFSTYNNILSFASEIKALWPLPWVTKTINPLALYHYLTFMVTPAPMTLYQQVYKLPAGYYLKLDAKKNISFCQWYDPLVNKTSAIMQSYSEQDIVKLIRSQLRKSVQKHLMSDVPVGAFLSGGIDSSLIVALMTEVHDNVKTFNVSFADGQEFSEIQWARKVARKFNTDHHEIIISEKEAFDFFETMVYHQDEPLADCVCIPLYYVSKLLKDAGVTVVLVGEGSDELFCGYESYTRYIQFYQNYWQTGTHFIPAFAKKSIYHLAKYSGYFQPSRLDKLKNFAHNRSLFWSGAHVFTEEAKALLFQGSREIIEDPIINKIYPALALTFDSHTFIDYHRKTVKKYRTEEDFLLSMIYLELKQRLPELLLARVDKMTMAVSVEARVPFLDHHFVEMALNIPSSLKYHNGITKYILKKAAETIIPHDVIYRKKIGFAAPITHWFKQGSYFRPFMQELINAKAPVWSDLLNIEHIKKIYTNHTQQRHDYSVELWTLQNLMATQLSDTL